MQPAKVYQISNQMMFTLSTGRRRPARAPRRLGPLINGVTYACLCGGLVMGMMRIFGA